MPIPSGSRVLLSWSSGKDSAWALHALRREGRVEVVGLLTTVDLELDRVPMHGVRRELLARQAELAGLPLWEVPLAEGASDARYEAALGAALERARAEGVRGVAFGDLFLEDVRRYREERMADTGLAPLFPLWGRDTAELAREMIEGGLVAHVTCVDTRLAPAELCGRRFDAAFLAELPAGADPCGERGEFHTFVSGGPMLRGSVALELGERSEREGFARCDLRPARASEVRP